mmetsp:Transcript_22443/g.36204  ORF Transcript_22443/g.36204 Transcript_22443/m.36204 type:complete len:299 (+) Transcript_22443:3864-4760(+)
MKQNNDFAHKRRGGRVVEFHVVSPEICATLAERSALSINPTHQCGHDRGFRPHAKGIDVVRGAQAHGVGLVLVQFPRTVHHFDTHPKRHDLPHHSVENVRCHLVRFPRQLGQQLILEMGRLPVQHVAHLLLWQPLQTAGQMNRHIVPGGHLVRHPVPIRRNITIRPADRDLGGCGCLQRPRNRVRPDQMDVGKGTRFINQNRHMGHQRPLIPVHRQNAKGAVASKGDVAIHGLRVENRIGVHDCGSCDVGSVLPACANLGKLAVFSGRGEIPHRRYVDTFHEPASAPIFQKSGVQQIR